MLPVHRIPPPFLIFQIPPSEGGNQTLLPPFKKSMCVYVCVCVCVRVCVCGVAEGRVQNCEFELAKKTPEQYFYC